LQAQPARPAEGIGDACVHCPVDVSDPVGVEAAVEGAAAAFGRIEVAAGEDDRPRGAILRCVVCHFSGRVPEKRCLGPEEVEDLDLEDLYVRKELNVSDAPELPSSSDDGAPTPVTSPSSAASSPAPRKGFCAADHASEASASSAPGTDAGEPALLAVQAAGKRIAEMLAVQAAGKRIAEMLAPVKVPAVVGLSTIFSEQQRRWAAAMLASQTLPFQQQAEKTVRAFGTQFAATSAVLAVEQVQESVRAVGAQFAASGMVGLADQHHRVLAGLAAPGLLSSDLAKNFATSSAIESMAAFSSSIAETQRLAMTGFVNRTHIITEFGELLPRLRPTVGNASLVAEMFGSQAANLAQAVASIGDLQAWLQKPLLEFQELGLRSFRSAVAFGQRAYFAVLAARDAVVDGDRDAVERFFLTWLDLPRGWWQERFEAGIEVLLHAPLEEFGPQTAVELLEWIEKRCNEHFRRGTRSLEDTELNHQRVVSIEQLPARTGMPDSSSEIFWPAGPSAEDRALVVLNQIQDDRLEVILGGMGLADARVVWAKMLGDESWQFAATACGLSESDGERVRAKLNRRVKRIMAVSAGASSPFGRGRR